MLTKRHAPWGHLQVTRAPTSKHILDTSLEALDCNPVPVLLPLVVNQRGASDTAVGANSSGSWNQRRLSAENNVRRVRLPSQQSSEGDQVKAVIAEAPKDIRRRLEPSAQESSGGSNELRTFMEESSVATTSDDTSSQESTENNSGDTSSAETTETSEQTDVEAASDVQSGASGKSWCPPWCQSGATTYDLLSSVTSCLDPVVDHVEPLHTMRDVYQNIAQAYDNVFADAPPFDTDMPLFLDENPKQPADSCLFCYDFKNNKYISQHERLPSGAFERFASSSHHSNIDEKQREASRVPDVLCGDDCQLQSSHAASKFQQQPLNAELGAVVPQSNVASGGSSLIPSIDEKSFINFLFSTMSNDNAGEDVAGEQLDPFYVDPNVMFLNENTDTFNAYVNPSVFTDCNNNVFSFPDSVSGYQELATFQQNEPHVEVADEMQVYSTRRLFSEPIKGSTSAPATESSHARTIAALPQAYQSDLGEKCHMTATQVFQVELSNMAPEFLRSLHEKQDYVKTEKGHSIAPSSRIFDVFSTEPERNYDLLKSSPERCMWAKARTPFSDGNALTQEFIPVSDEALKLRHRNGRNFFSDGNILGDAISGVTQAPQEVPGSPTKPTLRYPRPTFDNYKDLMRLFAPLRPVFLRGQRLLQQPPPLKPMLLTPPQWPLEYWTADVDAAADATPNANLGWAEELRLPSDVPRCLTDGDLNTENIESGVEEHTVNFMPRLLESRIPDGQQQIVATESSSSGANNSETFGTSSCEDNKDSSCTTTSLSVSEDSARTSTTTAESVAAPPRSLQEATFPIHGNMDSEEPRKESLAPLSSTGEGTIVNWGTHCSTLSLTEEAEFDGSAPLYDFASAAPSEEAVDIGGYNEVYPGTTKKTIPVRVMMPTIDEED
ncbi:uncharacterized protein LOC142768801 isoform X2 [Rhipicephalus microplus]|uniref:uncharacterized protein LOC142768801 isoform X2 n=1 Tax=Rhipicephalus microplus TaxID=6941 RepID=UPI003F6D4C04